MSQTSLSAPPALAVPLQSNLGLRVQIEGVSRNYGQVAAVADVSIDVAAGEFVSLLGPSGSGKTTLLMMLAGFEHPDAGVIRVGDRDVTNLAPNKRDIAMVFQRYALFPHMSVAENIAFPLAMRKIGRSERERRVEEALATVKLSGYGARKPAELSGGQQQRVALARAIVFDPPVILMDEPLGALDKKLRQHMQFELKQLQQRLGATVIYVTHDQEEALTMSDRVAVMSQGRLVQLGSPRELYDRPNDPFVADFLGEMNFLAGTVRDSSGHGCSVKVAGGVVHAGHPVRGGRPAVGEHVRVAVRPEAITVVPKSETGASGMTGATTTGSVEGTLTQLVFNGATIVLLIERPDGSVLQASMNPQLERPGLAVGEPVTASWSREAATVFVGEA